MDNDRVSLNRERVVHGALRFIDDKGVDALSMRKLGKVLGVEAMSLYNYVASKDELLDAVASLLLELVDLKGPEEPAWQGRARRISERVREVALAHPRAFVLLTTRSLSSFDSWSPLLEAFHVAQEAGYPPADAGYVVGAMSGYIVGALLLEIAQIQGGRRLQVLEVPPERAELRAYLAARGEVDSAEEFRRGFDLLLAGMEHQLR